MKLLNWLGRALVASIGAAAIPASHLHAEVPTIEMTGGLHGPRLIEASGWISTNDNGDPQPVFGVHNLFQPDAPPGDVPRNADSITEDGDLLRPGEYLWSTLKQHLEWHANDDPSGLGYVTAYFEVVQPSNYVGDIRVTVELVADTVHDSIGCTDELSVTAWRRELWTRGLGETWRPGGIFITSTAPELSDPWPRPGDFTPGVWLQMQWRYYDPRHMMGTQVTVPAGASTETDVPIAERHGPWWHTLPLQIFDSIEDFDLRPDLPVGIFVTPDTSISRLPPALNMLSTDWHREIYRSKKSSISLSHNSNQTASRICLILPSIKQTPARSAIWYTSKQPSS
ncbi:MAG: hypothetical protein AAF297_06550 [Planctomycetota bacterium]